MTDSDEWLESTMSREMIYYRFNINEEITFYQCYVNKKIWKYIVKHKDSHCCCCCPPPTLLNHCEYFVREKTTPNKMKMCIIYRKWSQRSMKSKRKKNIYFMIFMIVSYFCRIFSFFTYSNVEIKTKITHE